MASQAKRIVGRISGVFLIVAAPVGGVLAWVALMLLGNIAADPPYPPEEIPTFVMRCVSLRVGVALLFVPALLCGILLVRTKRTVPLIIAGTLALLLPFAIVLYCFVMIMAPMYEYRPI